MHLLILTIKKEAQHLVELSGFWLEHILYVEILLWIIRAIIGQASRFELGSEQKRALQLV